MIGWKTSIIKQIAEKGLSWQALHILRTKKKKNEIRTLEPACENTKAEEKRGVSTVDKNVNMFIGIIEQWAIRSVQFEQYIRNIK